jgi:uncharacterized membrane protein
MSRTEHNRLKQRRASQAAMLIAAASVPNTFQKTLMPRKTMDQGVITGATMTIDYFIISTIRKFIEDIADGMAGTKYAKNKDYAAHRRQQQTALFLDLAILGAGYYGQKKFVQKDDEATSRALMRTASTWLKYAAMAGLTIGALDSLLSGASGKDQKLQARYKKPWGLIGGAAFATYTEYRRRSAQKNSNSEVENTVNAVQAIGMGAGILAALAAVDAGEKLFAEVFSKQVNKALPGSEDFFWSVGHSTAVAGTALGIVSAVRRVYHKIEEVATEIEPAYLEPPSSKFISGGPGSLVDWQSLSVQGRRFVSGVITQAEIKQVMGTNGLEPIRIYAGIDSAETEEARLNLVIDELERTKAFDRKMLMLISPTGTGYVNYVAVESAELMSRGDIATAALQYSKRPSPMSLDRVPEGRLQFKMLVKAVSQRIAKQPAKSRPKLVVFGESLGAWTSQDAFINQGTDGLETSGIEKALWIGTPYGSKWKSEILGKTRPDVDKSVVGKFDNINEFVELPKKNRDQIKYVMLTHNNDPVALFNLGLLIREPQWLKDPLLRPPTVSHSQYYTSPGTFLLTLVDMGNAMNVVPGKFEANGHDYRADLPEFVRYTFEFNITKDQMSAIEKLLRENEIKRATKFVGVDAKDDVAGED